MSIAATYRPCPVCGAGAPDGPGLRAIVFCENCGTQFNRVTGVSTEPPKPNRIVVAGLDIPFNDLVTILVKVAIAAIPAMIILIVLGTLLSFLLLGLLAGLGSP